MEKLAAPLRSIVDELCAGWQCSKAEFLRIWQPRDDRLGFVGPGTDLEAARRAAQCLVAEWLVAYASGAADGDTSLAGAHDWFVADSARGRLGVPALQPYRGRPPLPATVFALLPYLLDFARPATRRDVLAGRAEVESRTSRKAQGVYLTPGDVAQFMVTGAGSRLPERGVSTWLDPAAGTGVFLRHVVETFSSAEVFGVDIDPTASEMAPFVLLAAGRGPGERPWERWHAWRSRFATGDALLCVRNAQAGRTAEQLELGDDAALAGDTASAPGGLWDLGEAFPQLRSGADVVIQNPPYAPPTAHPAFLLRHFGDSPQSMFPLFLRAGLHLVKADGQFAAVVPASIVNSGVSSIKRARAALAAAGGEVEILSYDRAPDGLFGDDVKTRASIVFADLSKAPSLRLGPLQRLTSRRRSEQFTRGISVPHSVDELYADQPAKVGTPEDMRLLHAVRGCQGRVAHLLLDVRQRPLPEAPEDEQTLVMAPTAYNWLNVHLSPRAAVGAGHDASNPYLVLRAASALHRDAAYAALSSRVTFWCWRTFGDGFHVNRPLLAQAPAPHLDDLSNMRRLAKLGQELWERSSSTPVASRNGGRTSVAFPPGSTPGTLELVSEIDQLLLDCLELSDGHGNLSRWMRDIAAVGREERRRGAVAWSGES